MRNKYGPVISLKLANKTAIVVQDDGTAMRELLEKRGAIYSSRPIGTIQHLSRGGYGPVYVSSLFSICCIDHACLGIACAFRNERDPVKWRLNRKLIMQHFSKDASLGYAKLQEAESTQLLCDLLTTPTFFEDHLLRYTVSVLSELSEQSIICLSGKEGLIASISSIWLQGCDGPSSCRAHSPSQYYSYGPRP